ncbi:MAG: hypothetical protein U5L73_10530 [Rhodoferax sp.]|nr:hypothetical protein [Rhodoferax sp.]
MDGRVSALQAWPVEMGDSYTASRLWERVADHRKIDPSVLVSAHALLPELPALLPLTLVLLDAGCSEPLVQTLVGRLPEHAWTAIGSDLGLPLEYASPGVKKKVISKLIKHESLRAYDLLQSSRVRVGITLTESQIEKLWSVGELSVHPVGSWLVAWSKEAPSDAMLAWASRDYEHHASRRKTAWSVIQNTMSRPNAAWPLAWDTWGALTNAPSTVAWSLGGLRHGNWLAAMTKLHSVVNRTTKMIVFSADLMLASLDADDKALAGKWSANVRTDKPEIERRLRAQMLTARAAEKCALSYFAGFGQSVRDIAISQLEDGATDWQLMDQQLSGQHGIDVKNCRHTPNGGLRSGKWKVKALKSDAAGNPVTLLGVSSPFTAFDGYGILTARMDWNSAAALSHLLPETGPDPMVVLGVTNAVEMHKLMARFKDVADIDMPAPRRLTEMPAWSWDYPNLHYRERNEVLAAARLEWEQSGSPLMQRLLAFAPPVLVSLLDLDLPAATLAELELQQQAYLEWIRLQWRAERTRSNGVSLVPRLPWLYLFTLHAWLRWRQTGQLSVAARIAPLFRAVDDPDASIPTVIAPSLASSVGVLDPARTLEALLSVLALLDSNVPNDVFAGMTRFTLHPNGVFRCRFPDGMMRTLVAHCGGRQQNFAECRHWPLVYGKETSCKCGRLICPKCESCTTEGMTCEHEQKKKYELHSENDAADELARPHIDFRAWLGARPS